MYHAQTSCTVMATLGLFTVLATAAAAQTFQVTLNTPDPVVIRPASGSENLLFTGTLKNLTPESQLVGYGVTFPFSTANTFLTGGVYANSGIPAIFAPNEVFSGDLFYLTVTSKTLPGTYSYDSHGNPAAYRVDSLDQATSLRSDTAALFTVKVNAAPVPETSTMVSFGLLLALGLGSVTIAAKRKKTSGGRSGTTV